MLIVGELINGMYKDVRKAIKTKDKSIIQRLAKDQVANGAGMLDVNTGPASAEPKSDMKWLIDSIQEVTDTPLCLDSTKPDVIEEGLKLVKTPAMINSSDASDEKLNNYLDMAKKYKAKLIALTMDKTGIPRNKDVRMEHAAKIVSTAMEKGFSMDDLYIDPVVLPVNVAQAQAFELLESLKEFKLLHDPAPNTIVGLSNISQGTKLRPLINRTFLIMAISQGLTAAIADPLDKDLVDAVITAGVLLNKNIYCDSFLSAYRKKK